MNEDNKTFIETSDVAAIAPSGDVLQAAQSIVVSDAAGEEKAASFLGVVKAIQKKIEAKRKEYVEPLNAVVTKINAEAKSAALPFVQAESAIKKRLADYATEMDRKRDEEHAARNAEQVRLLKEAAVAPIEKQTAIASRIDAVVAAPLPQTTKGVSADTGSVSYRMVWKWDVVKDAEIPREYLAIDNAKVTAAVRSGIRSIPGINIYEEKTVAVR